MFSDPLFTALPLVTARVIVPWDVQRTEPGRLETWLDAARAAGVEPLVALEHARGDRCPSAPCRLPAVADYEAAVRALVTSRPWVRAITPWNEPNHGSQPTAGNPRRAAAYYAAARAACPRCTLVAGDVLDAPGFLGWLAEYRRHLSEEPTVWGLHDYYDSTYGRTASVDGLLAAARGDVWLTETGGIVSFRRDDGRVNLPTDERRAAEGVSHVLALAAERPRVRRIYLYQWRSGPGADFDAGLLRADGTPRAGYRVLRGALAEHGGPPQMVGNTRIKLRGWARIALGNVSLPMLCDPLGGGRCTGRLTVESARWRTATLVNGRAPLGLIRPRSRTLDLSPGERSVARMRIGRRARGSLRVTLTEPGGETELVAPVVRSR